MIRELILWLGLVLSDGQALASTTATDMDRWRGATHVLWAEIAAREFSVDPNILLAIASGESGYTRHAVYAEHDGTTSCGVVGVSVEYSGIPCHVMNSSLEEGYRAGARALRWWLEHPRCRGDLHCALSGYAGGTRFMDNCRDRPQQWPWECAGPKRRIDLAARIRRARASVSPAARPALE